MQYDAVDPVNAISASTSPDHARHARTVVITWLLLALVMTISTILAFFLWRHNARAVKEHHVIESAQMVLLLVACGIHGGRAIRHRGVLGTGCRVGLAILCFTFAVRETDIDDLGGSPLWPTAEWVVRGLVIALWGAFIVLLLPRVHHLWPRWRHVLCSSVAISTVAGGALYVLSYPFDKEMMPLSDSAAMFVEEILQLNACLFFLAAAVLPFGRPQRSKDTT